jgi:exonuclease III
MKGGKQEEREGETKYERLRCMAWNVNGWRGVIGQRKIRRIRGEVGDCDMFILTETHVEDDDKERATFDSNFKDFHVFHVHAKEDGGRRLGVAMGVKKKKVEENDIEIEKEKDGEGGRWIVMTIKGMMAEPLHIWGIYAPVKTVLDRKKWMEKLGREMKKKKGMRVIAGDFNFVMDTRLDKMGGNKKRGTEGRKEQKKWEEELGVVDAWRKFNPQMVATTWTSRDKEKGKRVRTRIDRALIDERLVERTTETQIDKTTISDHDKITWTLETEREQTQAPYDRVTTDMIEDMEYQVEVKKIYEEERGGGLEGYERFKKRCVEKAVEMTKKKKKRRGRDRYKLNTEIQKMRRIIEWTENARIDQEEGRKIKRWKRGMKMLRESNTVRWMGKQVGEITDLVEVEEKAADHMDKLVEEREEGDGRKRRAEKNIEILREMQEEERGTRSFFSKMKRAHRKEEIFALMEVVGKTDTDEKIEEERTEKKDIQRVATDFYKDLWKKRRVSHRVRQQMIERISRKLTAIEKEELDKKLTMEEMKKTTNMMKKGKSTGIDGIPAEFYQKFEFVTEWLYELFGEMIERGEMTETMKMAIVKILFKKADKKRIENYRPISLLTADYKILAKILTERLKNVLTRLIGAEQQGFIPGGDIAGNLLLVKEIIAYCDEEGMEGAMIMMDFMKAYDRVDRDTMMKTMEAMNIGEGFRKMVRVLYAGSTARVVVNGEMGEEFRTEGGVRQGCPLSPLLFIIVLELMAIELRESEEIEGIKMTKAVSGGGGGETAGESRRRGSAVFVSGEN